MAEDVRITKAAPWRWVAAVPLTKEEEISFAERHKDDKELIALMKKNSVNG